MDHTLQAWQAAIQAMPALIKGVTALAEKGRLTALAQQIVAIPLPAPTAKGQTWRHYADRLFAILRDKRDLGHEWEFTDEAINKLNDYFYANELLVECLKVAAVSDRQAILNGLLLPPQGLNGEAV